MNTEELTNLFSYHPPFGDQEVRYSIIRDQARSMAIHIEKWCPRSREKSLAITKLQECVMMANAAIAIHEVKPEVAPDDERPASEMPTLDSMPDPPEHHEVSDEDRAAEMAEKELAEEEADAPPEVLNEAADDERAEEQTEKMKQMKETPTRTPLDDLSHPLDDLSHHHWRGSGGDRSMAFLLVCYVADCAPLLS